MKESLRSTSYKVTPHCDSERASCEIKHKLATYLTVSDAAKDAIMRRVLDRGKSSMGIRISVITKGCSGLSYKMEYADYDSNIEINDEIVPIFNSINLFIEAKSSLFFFGVTLDYCDNGVEYGFCFINPNEKGRCGCGQSFFA